MKQKPTILNAPEQRLNESDRDYYKRWISFLTGEDVRTKGDLTDWTGSFPFHLDKLSKDWPE